ncbi:MAG: hypothetical protein K0S38_970, partial [Candidatus Paceibacter sp.]|nr:hypothetical protein [Candidatus Paceibacter sp.]
MKKEHKVSIIVLAVLAGGLLMAYGIMPFFTQDIYEPI